jgi:hypothetical protein
MKTVAANAFFAASRIRTVAFAHVSCLVVASHDKYFLSVSFALSGTD